MANVLDQNPIIIDAAASSEVAGLFKIQTIHWLHNEDHAIAADNDLHVQNSAGKTILKVRQGTAKESSQFLFPQGYRTKGVKVAVIDGGEVHIFLC